MPIFSGQLPPDGDERHTNLLLGIPSPNPPTYRQHPNTIDGPTCRYITKN